MTTSTPPTPPALDRLRPRRRAPSVVVRRDEVPASAWTGLHLDGALVPVWHDVSRVADHADDAGVRAVAVAPLVPARGAVGRLAAAWVHAGGPPPARVTVLVRSGARRPDPHPGRDVAEADLVDADVDVVGGVAVTGLVRTAVDLARWVPAPTALTALRSLVALGLDPRDAEQRLAPGTGGRHVRTARRVLARLRQEAAAGGR